MSDAFASSSHPLCSSSYTEQTNSFSQALDILIAADSTSSVASLSAGPSTWHAADPANPHASLAPSWPSFNVKRRKSEEREVMEETKARFTQRLASDHALVLHPDADTPFLNTRDAVNRLLPYHVFQQPRDDLEFLSRGRKGKGKASEEDLRKQIEETRFALECHQRRDMLEARFRQIRVRSGKRTAPDDQAVQLASLLLDAERSETTLLSNGLRTARAELERREKEKRAAANSARTAYYGPTSTAVPVQYYRGYPYSYTQLYSAHAQATTSTFSVTPSAPFMNKNAIQSAIPIQLPVASLPALHALGIVPVPATSLPPDDQPQPPAVLRGSTSNGTMLSLEINVSLLQSAQMSGLATVLNSLMSRNSSTSTSNAPLEPTVSNHGDTATG